MMMQDNFKSKPGDGQSVEEQIAKAEVPTERKARVSLRAEPENMASTADTKRVAAAIQTAELGDTRELFALYRDLTAAGSHVQTEFNKRKLSVLSQTSAILPENKDNPDDVEAAEAVKQMISECENWMDGLIHLLDSVLWPVSVVEKIFRPGDQLTGPGKLPLQWTLKRLEIVNHALLCFQQPRVAEAPVELNAWEPDLRFYSTGTDGRIIYNVNQAYSPEQMRHMIHRGHLLVGIRDNWGGPMRAIVFWWLLASLGRDWFGRYMNRFGSPFILGKTDSTSPDGVQFLKDALSLSTRIGALVVDHETEVDLKEAVTSNAADAFEKFLNVCNREISKVIVGHTLSAEAQSTGLGSGVGNLQSDVREDLRVFDQLRLGETLRNQIFRPFLWMNGFKGAAPRIVWGGLSPEQAKAFAELLKALSEASFEPTDEAIPTISDRVGFQIQRKAAVAAPSFGGGSPFALSALSAAIPKATDPVDKIAAQRAKALGEIYRGSMAPFRQIILSSTSREDCLKNLAAFYPDWKSERLASEVETALQICSAAGAALGTAER
jgi:phage gp29-like protein